MERLSELMSRRQCLKNDTFEFTPMMQSALLKENEDQSMQLNREVIVWKEEIEKSCDEDEEKFCDVNGADIGDYFKVKVLPIPSTGTVNKYEVHSNTPKPQNLKKRYEM